MMLNNSPAPLHRAPGLLSAPQLDALAHALDEERQGCAAEPASPLGYWPSAVAGLLGHVAQMAEALDDEKAMGNQGIDHEFELMRKLDKAEARAAAAEAQVAMLRVELAEQERELSYERQMRQETEKAMIALADRVKWQTAEMAEQEVEKLALVKEQKAWKPNPFVPADEWGDEDGEVLWWVFPIQAAPYIGSPCDCDWDYAASQRYTHYQKIDERGYDNDRACREFGNQCDSKAQ